MKRADLRLKIRNRMWEREDRTMDGLVKYEIMDRMRRPLGERVRRHVTEKVWAGIGERL